MLRLILISFFAFISISPASPHFWMVQEEFHAVSNQEITDWQKSSPNLLSDFNFGSDQDCLERNENSISIVDCQNRIEGVKWRSGETWKVREAISADLNRDGRNELIMVVWRPFKPWPIDSVMPHSGRINEFHDNRGNSCHLILVGWDGHEYRELWAGSSLIDPVFNIRAADLDADGNLELVAIEGRYDSLNKTGNLTVWDWNGFGFRLRDRVKGSFSDYGIVSTNQSVLILSN